jgi:hypothetical protein
MLLRNDLKQKVKMKQVFLYFVEETDSAICGKKIEKFFPLSETVTCRKLNLKT